MAGEGGCSGGGEVRWGGGSDACLGWNSFQDYYCDRIWVGILSKTITVIEFDLYFSLFVFLF